MNNAPEVTVEFEAADYSIEEGLSVTVTVTLSADPKRSVIIPITATAQGGATAPGATGADYTAPAGSVTFASGQTERTLSLSITEDTTADTGEGVLLAIGASLPDGVTLGARTVRPPSPSSTTTPPSPSPSKRRPTRSPKTQLWGSK